MTPLMLKYFVGNLDHRIAEVICSECMIHYTQSKKMWAAKVRRTGMSRCSECSKKYASEKTRKLALERRIKSLKVPKEYEDQIVDHNEYILLPKSKQIRVFCKKCSNVFYVRKDHIKEKYSRMGALFCSVCAHLEAKDYDKTTAYIKFIATLRTKHQKAILPAKEVKRRYDQTYVRKRRKATASEKLEKSKYDAFYRFRNRTRINAKSADRLKNDLQAKIRVRLRQRLGVAIKGFLTGKRKPVSAVKDLGCSISEFIVHIENQFKDGMSWNNWSRSGWHLDHIVPLSRFDLSDAEQAKKACHYSNLQPMWASENISKGNR